MLNPESNNGISLPKSMDVNQAKGLKTI
jgi:hypothetical protein